MESDGILTLDMDDLLDADENGRCMTWTLYLPRLFEHIPDSSFSTAIEILDKYFPQEFLNSHGLVNISMRNVYHTVGVKHGSGWNIVAYVFATEPAFMITQFVAYHKQHGKIWGDMYGKIYESQEGAFDKLMTAAPLIGGMI